MTELPELFKSAMRARLGQEAEAFIQSLHDPSPVSIRYNLQKMIPSGGVPIPWCASGRYLSDRPPFTLDPVFHAGGYYVQEASSMLLEQAVKQTVDLTKPLVVLDLCAAPGGKSTHLASLLTSTSLLVSNEVIRSRASILAENIEKWGTANVLVTHNDPADFLHVPELMDLMVVDAPCSGEGLFRKEPEAVQEWSPRNVELCALRQRRIVADAWAALKPGGVMIYSTCTYNDEENVNNLTWLKDQYHPEFIALALDPAWGVSEISFKECKGYQCYPHWVKGEGFFFAALRKPGTHTGRLPRVKSRLHKPKEKEIDPARNWIQNSEGVTFFLHGQQIRFINDAHVDLTEVVLDRLHVIQAGTAMGEITKNKIIPDHGLALSLFRNPGAFPSLSLTLDEALVFLRKDPMALDSVQRGFHAITYKDLALGWVNVLPGRINNLYPSARRIRMSV